MSFSRGSRNLLILGGSALLVTLISTSVSLAMYRLSGDIYLDRSRPGYLPEQDEIEEANPDDDFSFTDSGAITTEDLEEYLQELQKLNQRLQSFVDPYSPTPLSDESLGIPSELEED